MRVRTLIIVFFFGTLFAAPPLAFADTILAPDSEISEDTVWTKVGSPYVIESGLTIDASSTLTIEAGVVVRSDSGWLDVLGQLYANGTTDEPISFTNIDINFANPDKLSSMDQCALRGSTVFDNYSKGLAISNTTIEDVRDGVHAEGSHLSLDSVSIKSVPGGFGAAIDISDGSVVTMTNVTVEGDFDRGVEVYVDSHADISHLSIDRLQGEALAVYVNSSVRLAGATITNVHADGEILKAFEASSLDISGLTLAMVKGIEALSVFNDARVVVSDSSFSDTDVYDVIGAYNPAHLTLQNVQITNGTEDGLGLYGGIVDIQNVTISGFTRGAGIVDYGTWGAPPGTISLTRNSIYGNDVGIGIYADNPSYVTSSNSIRDNASYGVAFYGVGTIDVRDIFWGDASGPQNDPANLMGKGNAVLGGSSDGVVLFSPWRTSDPLVIPTTPDSCIAAGTCVSNVLFLPGIEGSRLYEGTACGKSEEERLWEPVDSAWSVVRGVGDGKVADLALDASGASVCSDIYTKEGDVIDKTMGGNLYASLIAQMNDLKAAGTIADWEPVSYDWRLSLDDLLTKGAEHDGKIYYEEATSTPYIEQTLRALAKSSKTGRVTIVAHSNGGLVTKALLNRLGDDASGLVDKVILVGVPQTGAPYDVGAMLVGDNAGIYAHGVPIVSNKAARALVQNSPMAYHLLPSQSYFDSVMDDPAHPVARFAGDAYAKEVAAYGPVIGTLGELDDFLVAKDGGRVKPAANTLTAPEVLSPSLIGYANGVHNTLDAWVPPAGIEVDQIAGWGVDTVAGIDFYTQPATDLASLFTPVRSYRPIMTEDGDGTVPVPSALAVASSANVKRYWLDLSSIYRDTKIRRSHPDLFEIPSLQDLIRNILQSNTSALPPYISTDSPPSTSEKKLTFYLHSPLTLQLTDSSDNLTGLASDGSVTQDIPGSSYGEFGEVKWVTVPEGSYQLTLHGLANGSFSLDLQESTGGVVTASSTLVGVPTTASTLASLTIAGGLDTASPLTVDENGDGKSVFTITPKMGETVTYESPKAAPAPVSPAAPLGGGVILPHVITPVVSVSTSSLIAVAATTLTKSPTLRTASSTPAHKGAVVAQAKRGVPGVAQTASAYNASQQLPAKGWGSAVYNGLHSLWAVLKKFF